MKKIKYKPSFLAQVERFDACGREPCHGQNRSEVGLRQFFDRESRGIRPAEPDWYYTLLVDGKAWWEWTLNEIYAKRLGTDLWFGWFCYALDFIDDPAAFRQIRQRCHADPCDPKDIIGPITREEVVDVPDILATQPCVENPYPGQTVSVK